ncbi:glycosyltransferase involved in cell wall biosynthesis [Kineothrix alysoides]|uniref:Glycosyltransferase involved in cell wall biosynthesis n=1 Tax=Kineothrix alysoides TaxID=1469948 RepID=A0A4R1R271_9FIRM|nr:glycosyltransferase involved in cell wall biosynthesis [Kineothrix alysoides]
MRYEILEKRKIAFHLNCLEQGGAERVVSNLANQFAKEGYEVLIATQWYGENEFQIDERIRRVHVGLTEEDEKKSRAMQFFLKISHLKAFMKEEKPDVLIAFAQRANYRALMASFFMRVPVIISVRTDPMGHYDALSDKIQIPLLFPRAAGCVFQTEGQREFFAPFLQKKSRIILNPLHDKYIGVPKPLSRTKEVVQSGRLVDFKNQPMLLRAFIQVHKKHPDYTLKIYGPDSFDGTREILEGIIEENHAEDYIKLMGGSDSLEKDLTDAAVYAFSSDWEGMPNALLEAMALGLPIVATDCPCGGPRTIMKNGINGLLIEIKDQKALEEGINKLIENPEYAEELGDNARKICEIANSKAIFEQWRDYIEEICSKSKR